MNEKLSMSEERIEGAAESPAPQPAVAAIPLSDADIGQEVVLSRVDGGRGLLHRLAEMGIRPGARFSVLSKGRPGPFIISMRHTRLVLGQGLVHRMIVRVA